LTVPAKQAVSGNAEKIDTESPVMAAKHAGEGVQSARLCFRFGKRTRHVIQGF